MMSGMTSLSNGIVSQAPKTKKKKVFFKPKYNITSYLRVGFVVEEREFFLKTAMKVLLDFKQRNNFDAIAFRGYSGLAVGTLLSYKLNIPVVAVRK